MPNVTGIRFHHVGKVYHFATGEFKDLEFGDWVIVQTARGTEAGQVVVPPREVPGKELKTHLKSIVRRATAWDMTQLELYRQKESSVLDQCREKVAELELPMKAVKAEYNFDGSHITFYFTAEKRVDFRILVRELSSVFKARIELRQVGVRDEVKVMGGLGSCGRAVCCVTHLTEFAPISIKMAKQQNLPLSPMEISGRCGRLLCCLGYENDHYIQAKSQLPKVGSKIQTALGWGKVRNVNVIKETLMVELDKGGMKVEVQPGDVIEISKTSKEHRRRKK